VVFDKNKFFLSNYFFNLGVFLVRILRAFSSKK